MIVSADLERCSGHGACEALRPDIFEVGDDGLVHILLGDVPVEFRADVDEAVQSCPTRALQRQN